MRMDNKLDKLKEINKNYKGQSNITGYEELYMDDYVKQGQKAKYDFMRAFKNAYGDPENGLVHDVAIDFLANENKATGMGAFQAYANMIEQQVGPKNYQIMLKNYSNYDQAMKTILAYQNNKQNFDKTKAELDQCEKRIKDIEKNILELTGSLHDLDNSALDGVKEMVTKLQQERTRKEEISSELKPVNPAQVKKEVEELAKSCYQILDDEVMQSPGWRKFKKPEFEKELEQDYVNSMLLPGEDKKEQRFRSDAKSKYAMFDIEREACERAVSNSQELLDHLRKHGINEPLPQEMIEKHNIADNLYKMSNWNIQESDPLYTIEEQKSKYYTHIANRLKETDYAANAQLGEMNTLFKEGIDDYKIGTAKGVVNKLKAGLDYLNGKPHTKATNMHDMYDKVIRRVWEIDKSQASLKKLNSKENEEMNK